jgi:hypothetical protein
VRVRRTTGEDGFDAVNVLQMGDQGERCAGHILFDGWDTVYSYCSTNREK